MKKLILFFLTICMLQFSLQAQTTEFSDDFESGTANWTLEGDWGTTTAQSNSTTNSLTDSPGGLYANNVNNSATMANGVDLSTALDAEVSFWAIYDIEQGFDYLYVEASGDGGATWINLATFDGDDNLSPWIEYTYSLGGFVGNSDVKVRFRMTSDGGLMKDGMYIDDVEILSNDTDNAAPLIVHTPTEFYESVPGDITLVADLIDISGIASTTLWYSVNGGVATSISGTNTGNDTYEFVIPEQVAGAQVDYFVEAVDSSPNMNAASSSTFSYIAGQHIIYDNAVTDFITSFGPDGLSGAISVAVRFSLFGDDIKYALIRNYTDANNPNDDLEFHIWESVDGLPGPDLITPFMVTPEASLSNTSPMTRVDLSAYSAELAGIGGDVFMGFTVPSGQTFVTYTVTTESRGYAQVGGMWGPSPTFGFHFRLVTTETAAAEECMDATNIDGLLGGGINNPQTSPIFNNVDATTSASDPTDGWECYGEPDGGGSMPSLENTQWFTFVGDGNLYNITTTDCGGTVTDYIDFGDTQMSIYSGADCANLTSVLCNEDAPDVDPNGPYPAGAQFQTEAGVTYFMMIDGFNGSDGEYCVEFTEVSAITCDDIAVGVGASSLDVVCLDGTVTLSMQDLLTVIPIVGPLDGFAWAISTEDISNSTTPFANPPTLGGLGGVFPGADDFTFTYNAATAANIPPGQYYFTPVVLGGAVDTDGTFAGLDFSNGCVLAGVSFPVLLVGDVPITATSGVTDASTPSTNDGEATVTAEGGSGEYTYMWSSGDMTATATGLAGGDYSVTISDPNGCAADLVVDVTVGITTGIEDVVFGQSIDLFPNPADNKTSIQYNFKEALDLSISVTNSIGQVVFVTSVQGVQNGQIDLDLQEYTNGIYFIKLSDGERQAVQRLVVNK